MKAHTDYPELENLEKDVHKQRRLLAGQIRVTEDERSLREKIDQQLEAAGVDVVTVTIPLGTFEVRRAVSRGGNRYATVTRLQDGQQPSESS